MYCPFALVRNASSVSAKCLLAALLLAIIFNSDLLTNGEITRFLHAYCRTLLSFDIQ